MVRSYNDLPRVKLSTIHAAKGGEADNVLTYIRQHKKDKRSSGEKPRQER